MKAASAQPSKPVRTVEARGPRASVSWGPRSPLALMAGPCVIESRAHCLGIARKLAALSAKLGIPLVFKASFDKANRSSLDAYRGPGIDAGLDILAEVREATGLPVLTDIHEPWQAERAAKAVLEADAAYAETLRGVFRRRRDRIRDAIAQIPCVRADRCEGAFYLWIDISAVEADDAAFCSRLLEAEGVALTPGSAFLCPGHVRLAYAAPEPVLAEAAARFARFVRSCRASGI